MCSYQTLFHDDNTGYAVRCKACEKIQLGFGNLMLTMDENEFDSFRILVKTTLDEQSIEMKESVRCIVIPTPCEGIKLLLSRRELHLLDRMVEDADTELKSVCLLELFN